MKITVYTISDCQFSKQEKEYLGTNKLVYEEKNLETNKDFLTEMLAVSNNFAGTPVTRVEKDDGSIAVLKGFTKAEFDTTFGFSAEVKPPVEAEVKPASPAEAVAPAPVPTDFPPMETPVTPVVEPDPLKSVMDDLQAKAEPFDSAQGKPTSPVVEQPSTAPPIQPTMTDLTNSTTPPADAPAIPDFPAK